MNLEHKGILLFFLYLRIILLRQIMVLLLNICQVVRRFPIVKPAFSERPIYLLPESTEENAGLTAPAE